jgi:hypothetical protein
MPVKFASIEPDSIVDVKLSAIVLDIEALLKPFQHSLKTEIEMKNGVAQTISITAKINPR